MARRSGRTLGPVACVPRPREWQVRYEAAAAAMRSEEQTLAESQSRQPNRWYAIAVPENAAEPARVDIAAEIGFWGVTAQEFIDEIRSLGARPIDLHVNSPGGEVFDGMAILNAIIDHPGRVVAYVDGLAASAASFIVQGADEVVMKRGAMMMIHDAIGGCYDNAAGMRASAEVLDAVSDSIADVYAARAGETAAHWRAIMSREDTWYTAARAVEVGLADRVEGRGTPDGEGDDAVPEDVKALLPEAFGPMTASQQQFVPWADRTGTERIFVNW